MLLVAVPAVVAGEGETLLMCPVPLVGAVIDVVAETLLWAVLLVAVPAVVAGEGRTLLTCPVPLVAIAVPSVVAVEDGALIAVIAVPSVVAGEDGALSWGAEVVSPDVSVCVAVASIAALPDDVMDVVIHAASEVVTLEIGSLMDAVTVVRAMDLVGVGGSLATPSPDSSIAHDKCSSILICCSSLSLANSSFAADRPVDLEGDTVCASPLVEDPCWVIFTGVGAKLIGAVASCFTLLHTVGTPSLEDPGFSIADTTASLEYPCCLCVAASCFAIFSRALVLWASAASVRYRRDASGMFISALSSSVRGLSGGT
jgi:hypothetical protein